MTELKNQLLSGFEQLKQSYSRRLDDWQVAFAE
ncbi:MbeD/MobD family mobilization/exclusion protein [Buttiauxella sp. BIGb0552]